MNRVFVVSLALVAVLAAVYGEEKYTDKWDNINVDDILNNSRLVGKYIECLLAGNDDGCSADAKELKKVLPDAVATGCSKCTDKQKVGAKKTIRFLHDHKAAEWEKLLDKWDPTKEYRTKYEHFSE